MVIPSGDDPAPGIRALAVYTRRGTGVNHMRAVAAACPGHRFHISLRESRAENYCLKTGQRERRGAFALLARMARTTGQDERTALLRCCPFAFPCESLKGDLIWKI